VHTGPETGRNVDYAADLDLALRMADLADEVTIRRFRAADLRVSTKPDRSPVTDADTATEDLLRGELATARPADAVLGEERGGPSEPAAQGQRAWVIDPIDGTKNFSRGMPVWATLIALTEAGRPVVGVVSAPALARRWWGSAGGGSWTRDSARATPRRIAVSRVGKLADAYLSTTDLGSFLAAGTAEGYLELTRRCWTSRAFGDFWQHVLVAEGVLDLAVDPEVSAWDVAAIQVLVEEAGGRFTDLAGRRRHDLGSGMSSNGLLHEAALGVLR
jgi:histidinol-phosphatase